MIKHIYWFFLAFKTNLCDSIVGGLDAGWTEVLLKHSLEQHFFKKVNVNHFIFGSVNLVQNSELELVYFNLSELNLYNTGLVR